LLIGKLLLFTVEVTAEDGAAGIQAVCSVAAWRLRYQFLREVVNSLAVWHRKIPMCSWGMCLCSIFSLFWLSCHYLPS